MKLLLHGIAAICFALAISLILYKYAVKPDQPPDYSYEMAIFTNAYLKGYNHFKRDFNEHSHIIHQDSAYYTVMQCVVSHEDFAQLFTIDSIHFIQLLNK